MNQNDARNLLRDLLTDYHADRLRDLCAATGDDFENLRSEVATLVDRIDLDAATGRVFAVADDGAHTLHEWADLDQIAAIAEQHEATWRPLVASPAALVCPDWCDRVPGHSFEQYANGTRREHVHRFGDRGTVATLEQIERSPDPSTGVSDLGIDPAATTIRVQYGPGAVHHMTAAGARRFAAQLIAAADLHDLDADTV